MMYDELDGAQMVMSCPNTEEYAIVWHGSNYLKLIDMDGVCIDIRTFDINIKDIIDARAKAEEWFDELKDGEDFYKYPEPTTTEPTTEELKKWFMEDGGCETTDGCWVEPDGKCCHGHVSWMRYLGLI